MLLHEISTTDRTVIHRSDGGFWINDTNYVGSVLVVGQQVAEWPPTSAAAIDASSLQPVVDADPSIDLLLLGTGTERMPLVPTVAALFATAEVTVEVMSTASAVRAYNALVGDARAVAGAFIIT